MDDIFELKNTDRVRTAYGEFYRDMVDKGFVQYQHQLFCYAFLVGLINERKGTVAANHDICQIQNLNINNLKIIKGIAVMKIDADNGDELLKEMIAYADGGIEVLKRDFEMDGTIRLDKYID